MSVSIVEKGLMKVTKYSPGDASIQTADSDPSVSGNHRSFKLKSTYACHGSFKMVLSAGGQTVSANCDFSDSPGEVYITMKEGTTNPLSVEEADNTSGQILTKKFIFTVPATIYSDWLTVNNGELQSTMSFNGNITELSIGSAGAGTDISITGNGRAQLVNILIYGGGGSGP